MKKEKKGFAANPENINKQGRPKKGACLTDLLRTYLDGKDTAVKDKTRKQLLVEKLYERAMQKEDLTYLKYIFDRIDGRPTEKKEIDLDTDMNVTFQIIGE